MNISDSGWSPSSPPANDTGDAGLGQQDFLKLLITQISQQDPLNPASSSDFLAQLAEFSGLEQMISMNQKLDALALSEAASTSTSIAALIGRTVTAIGSSVELGETESVEITFDLPASAEDVEVTIMDEDGRVVRTLTLGGRSAGENLVTWDGCDQDGNRLDPGIYTFSVRGTGEDGEMLEASGRISGQITGVTYDKGYPELLLGERRISLGDVIEIV